MIESADILNSWKYYCQNLYADNATNGTSESDIEDIEDISDLIPLRAKVGNAIKTIKHSKSAGCDNIPTELLIASGESGVMFMQKLSCVKIWNSVEWPIEWYRVLFILFLRKVIYNIVEIKGLCISFIC